MTELDYIIGIIIFILFFTQIVVWVLYFKALNKKNTVDGQLVVDLTKDKIGYKINTPYLYKELIDKKQIVLDVLVKDEFYEQDE